MIASGPGGAWPQFFAASLDAAWSAPFVRAGVGQPASCGGEGDSAIGRLPDDMTADDAEAAQINTLHIDIPVPEEARVARRL